MIACGLCVCLYTAVCVSCTCVCVCGLCACGLLVRACLACMLQGGMGAMPPQVVEVERVVEVEKVVEKVVEVIRKEGVSEEAVAAMRTEAEKKQVELEQRAEAERLRAQQISEQSEVEKKQLAAQLARQVRVFCVGRVGVWGGGVPCVVAGARVQPPTRCDGDRMCAHACSYVPVRLASPALVPAT